MLNAGLRVGVFLYPVVGSQMIDLLCITPLFQGTIPLFEICLIDWIKSKLRRKIFMKWLMLLFATYYPCVSWKFESTFKMVESFFGENIFGINSS